VRPAVIFVSVFKHHFARSGCEGMTIPAYIGNASPRVQSRGEKQWDQAEAVERRHRRAWDFTGTILAKELVDAGLKVVGLERGGWRDTDPDCQMPYAHDELRYARRHELMQGPVTRDAHLSATPRRHRPRRCAIWGPSAGEGVAARVLHWDAPASRGRFLSWWNFVDAQPARPRPLREGPARRKDCTSQDWGVTYDELEPALRRFEYLYGICGKAGNLKGKSSREQSLRGAARASTRTRR